jgi:hypothetical protein
MKKCAIPVRLEPTTPFKVLTMVYWVFGGPLRFAETILNVSYGSRNHHNQDWHLSAL